MTPQARWHPAEPPKQTNNGRLAAVLTDEHSCPLVDSCADAFDAKLDDLVCMAHQAELYWAEQGAPYFGLTMELLQWWRNRKGESRRKRPSCHRPGSWRTPAVCASPGACELWPGAVLALMDGNFSYGTRRRARAREPKCAST